MSYIKPGTYPTFDFRFTDPSGPIFKRLRIWGSGRVTFRVVPVNSFSLLKWTHLGNNVYQATWPAGNPPLDRLLRTDVKDAFRYAMPLPKRNSAASVTTLKSGWFFDVNAHKITVSVPGRSGSPACGSEPSVW